LELLNYEGQGESPDSHCCDVCEGRAQAQTREEAALLAFFHRNPRRFTLTEAAAVLSGKDSAGEQRWSAAESRLAAQILVKEGKLRELKGPLWKEKLVASP
jgi:ATP-dependent DNA helicase RecQ